MFDGVISSINDMMRSLLFGPLGAILGWLIDIVSIIMNEIAKFSFIDLEFVTECYNTCVTIALVILPLKLIYEWIWLVLSNDIEKWNHKLFAILQIAIIIVLTPPLLTQVGSTVASINESILSGEVVSGQSSDNAQSSGEGFAQNLLVATTGLTNQEAEDFIEDFTSDDFNINEKDEDDQYVYEFDFLLPMFMGIAMWVCVFFVGLQMASRQVSLAFFKIITPLCVLSLTNKENPTAFTVWKNNVMGAFLMNIVQIFLFLFMFKLLDGLDESTSGLAKLLFTIALLLVIIAIPNKVASMIGGYNAGIMEGLAGMQQILMMTSSGLTAGHVINSGLKSTGGAIASGGRMIRNMPKNISGKAGGVASMVGSMKDSVQNSSQHVRDAMKYNGVLGGGASIGKEVALNVKDKFASKGNGVVNEFQRGKRESDLNRAFNKPNAFVVSESVPPRNNSTNEVIDTPHHSFEKINTGNQMNASRRDKEERFK